MAKSLRSKVKRDFRSKKRETGTYAATEAARLNRLSAKLASAISKKTKQDEGEGDDMQVAAEGEPDTLTTSDLLKAQSEGSMDVDGSQVKKISTHGRGPSRREEWRTSKGMSAKPKSKGMNRQGTVAAARKSGRSKRRR